MVGGIYCFEHKYYPIIYIGASKNIENRYEGHIKDFKSNKHPNRALNKDYNDGLLTFNVLEKINGRKKTLNERESYYFNLYLNNNYLLYNRVPPIYSQDDYILITGFQSNKINSYSQDAQKMFHKNIKLKETIQKQQNTIEDLKQQIEALKVEKQLWKKYSINIFDEL